MLLRTILRTGRETGDEATSVVNSNKLPPLAIAEEDQGIDLVDTSQSVPSNSAIVVVATSPPDESSSQLTQTEPVEGADKIASSALTTTATLSVKACQVTQSTQDTLSVLDVRNRRERILRQKSSTETSGLGSSIDYTSADNLSRSTSPIYRRPPPVVETVVTIMNRGGVPLTNVYEDNSPAIVIPNCEESGVLSTQKDPNSHRHSWRPGEEWEDDDNDDRVFVSNQVGRHPRESIDGVHTRPKTMRSRSSKSDYPSTSRHSSERDHNHLCAPELDGANCTTWFHWSKERRLQCEKRAAIPNSTIMETERLPSPILRARQESRTLVAPELERVHIPHADLEAHHKKMKKKPMLSVKRGQKRRRAHQASNMEKNFDPEAIRQLYDFWEHDLFVRARSWAMCFVFIGIGLLTFVLISRTWIFYGDEHHPNYGGLWVSCFPHNSTCWSLFTMAPQSGATQKAVIGLLIFAEILGFIGSCLSFGALCVTSLAKKIYYYHSAGEIFFVAALCSTAGMVIYPFSVEKIINKTGHTYGYAYFLGWVSCGLFALSAFCMMLDEIIKESARPIICCPCCFKKRRAQALAAQSQRLANPNSHIAAV